MTDRYNSFIVVLEQDIRSDDAKKTTKAIEQIKGVLKVTPNIVDVSDIVAESRAEQELANKLFDVIYGDKE
ncbi:hypothetical protein M0R19_05765 [Candidatus Pacearchaeota archaeon]|nr:hypothetical protein [Candidatus Pacearchaeota archaeon]